MPHAVPLCLRLQQRRGHMQQLLGVVWPVDTLLCLTALLAAFEQQPCGRILYSVVSRLACIVPAA
jgi:hypothetical protein